MLTAKIVVGIVLVVFVLIGAFFIDIVVNDRLELNEVRVKPANRTYYEATTYDDKQVGQNYQKGLKLVKLFNLIFSVTMNESSGIRADYSKTHIIVLPKQPIYNKYKKKLENYFGKLSVDIIQIELKLLKVTMIRRK